MSWLRSTKGADLVEGAGEDIEGVLLLDELGGNAVEEPPRLLVVGRPVLGKVLCVYQRVLDHDKVSRTGMMFILDNWTPRQDQLSAQQHTLQESRLSRGIAVHITEFHASVKYPLMLLPHLMTPGIGN